MCVDWPADGDPFFWDIQVRSTFILDLASIMAECISSAPSHMCLLQSTPLSNELLQERGVGVGPPGQASGIGQRLTQCCGYPIVTRRS